MNTNVINLSIADIHADQSLQKNERYASFGNPLSEFPEAFAQNGWDVVSGIVIAYELTDDEKDNAIKQRQEQVKQWRDKQGDIVLFERDGKNVLESYVEIANYAEALWTDEKGNWIRPTYGANCCFRRLYAVVASLMAYMRWDKEREPFTIPVLLKQYPTNPTDRFRAMRTDRLNENAQLGRAGYTDCEKLAIACMDVKVGYNEVDLRRRLNLQRGMAQKLHALALICNKYDELSLLERFNMPKPVDAEGKVIKPVYVKGGYIPLSPFNASVARSIIGNVKSIDKMDNRVLTVLGADARVDCSATPEQVEQVIELIMNGASKGPSMMSKDTLQTIKKGLSDSVIELHKILGSILSGNAVELSEALDDTRAKLAKTKTKTKTKDKATN